MSPFSSRGVRLWLLFILLGSSSGFAAQLPSAITLAPDLTLARLTRNSAYIFSGTVLAVQQVPPSSNHLAVIQVTFHVDQGILGVRTGETLRVWEWAGLWESGARYRPGERLMLFLHRPSRLGLTSPVGGPMGRFNVDRSGSIVLNPSLLGPARTGGAGSVPVKAPTPPGKIRVNRRDFARAIWRVGRE
jgi:hypothetical protein